MEVPVTAHCSFPVLCFQPRIVFLSHCWVVESSVCLDQPDGLVFASLLCLFTCCFVGVDFPCPVPEGLRNEMLGVVTWDAQQFIVTVHLSTVYYYYYSPSLFDDAVNSQPQQFGIALHSHNQLLPGQISHLKQLLQEQSLFEDGSLQLQ